MKTEKLPASPSSRPPQRERGVALVIVLAMLVLLSSLVIAFLSSSTASLSASKAYEDGEGARLMADSAVNLVIAQIREASTKEDEAWISQPGLIRTYKVGGAPSAAYKLYSSDAMVVNGDFDPSKNQDLPPAVPENDPSHWSQQPALWTDLNAPVLDPSRTNPKTGEPYRLFPILDGNHINEATGELALDGANRDIEGFRVEDYDNRGVAMPVRWLYLLQDGTIAPAQPGSDPLEAKVELASESNPVIGRIAFWTDDESSKVNINTASEGTFWDTPVGNSQPMNPTGGRNDSSRAGYRPSSDLVYEWDLAEFMAGQKEYQRYPGHPATTSLSPIFGRQLQLSLGLSDFTTFQNRQRFVEAIYQMIPRISGVGTDGNDWSSKGGTARAGGNQTQYSNETRMITVDQDRLFPSIDELIFKPFREKQELAPGVTNSHEILEMSKFFITAHSRAPEQNLFNKPRVAIWPVNTIATRRTAFDRLIAFCSTVGSAGNPTIQPRPFIFDRRDPSSATVDWSSNNQKIYRYLQTLTSQEIPGIRTSGTNTFLGKYGPDRDQILTQIFDYIRSTNLIDTDNGANPNLAYTPLRNAERPTTNYLGDGKTPSDFTYRGQVVPIQVPNGTRGFGRIATISELAMSIIRKPDTELDASERSSRAKIEIAFFPELFSPMAGYSALANNIRIKFDAESFKVTDLAGTVHQPFRGVPQPDMYDIGRTAVSEEAESKIGGNIGIRSLLQGSQGSFPKNAGSPADSVPPNAELKVAYTPGANASNNYVTVEGRVTAQLFAPHTAGAPIQVFEFDFPPTRVRIPTTVPMIDGTPAEMASGPSSGSRVKGPMIKGGTPKMVDSGSGTQTIRSLVPNGPGIMGDMRLVAAQSEVPSDAFGPGPRYTNIGVERAHSLRGWNRTENGTSMGYLVAGMAGYSEGHARPDVPEGINGVTNYLGQPGDWDNGPHLVQDGPLINKPDEGTGRHEHVRSGTDVFAGGSTPYIGWGQSRQDLGTQQDTFFSPNRMISSPVMFGSLPTGVKARRPWQTLLFRPAKAYLPGGTNHPGSGRNGPPDHLLLDLFWMPVVEPYAISEPFATAGKINMNSQIAPFTYLKRDTGLRAALSAVKITALDPNQRDRQQVAYINNYKTPGSIGTDNGVGGGHDVVVRWNVDIDKTLKQFEERFAQNQPFISASEICDIPLIPADNPKSRLRLNIPENTTNFDSALANFWSQHKLTGDNSLERPYSHLYPRLTTRSNTYTVHVCVQTLRKAGGDDAAKVVREGRDMVGGEFRGSFIIERYLDPNLQEFQNDTDTLGPYRFRVVSSKQFAR